MKNLQLKIKHELFNLECPESWEEIKVKHFIKLEGDWDGQNMVKLLSILTGIEYGKIANSTTKTAQQFADLVQFVINNQPDFNNLEKKKAIFIDGIKIKMPKSLEFETFGQMDAMKDVLSQGKENVIKNIPRIMAIYCQPSLIGEFNENRLDEIEKKILELPILDVYAHCFFFLQTANKVLSNWGNILERLPQTQEQRNNEILYKNSGGKRLDKYDSFNIIDNLVSTYPVYTHKDIINLPYNFVMQLLAYNKEKAYINSIYNENQKKLS